MAALPLFFAQYGRLAGHIAPRQVSKCVIAVLINISVGMRKLVLLAVRPRYPGVPDVKYIGNGR
jgi:hypothetical protein